jgi:hypothetical protein
MILPTILYIVSFRAKNLYRKKNIKIVLQWLNIVQKYLFENYAINLDICIVEQDREQWDLLPKNNVKYIFLQNKGCFNKGWSFNVAVNTYPEYNYYIFADADIIIPAIDALCDGIAEYTIVSPKMAFRPFTDRLNTTNGDCVTINTFDEFIPLISAIKNNLQRHLGLSFASNIICISKDTFTNIGGWDEIFIGWGRFDDFLGHKLEIISDCPKLYIPIDAIHLWHPITLDFSLASSSDNIHYYNIYIKYSKNELIQMITQNAKTNGNIKLYAKN